MKITFLKWHNKLLAFLLSLIGVGAACTTGGCEYGTPADEYGTPSAKFIVNGKVTSESNTAIQGIRVIMKYDTVYTDSEGDYSAKTIAFPESQTFTLKFEDVDGTSNGSYQAQDTTATFTDPQFTNGDGDWYSGETSQELNIKLKTDTE
jgi:putative lipoprotein (rSAM/lipoprotein system)